jgi:hypothetical protein
LNANPWTVLILSGAALTGVAIVCGTAIVMADKPHGPEIVGRIVEVLFARSEDEAVPELE